MSKAWYYAKDGNQIGPVPSDELKSLLRDGTIGPDDLLWREGFPDWRPARQVVDFAKLGIEPPSTAPLPSFIKEEPVPATADERAPASAAAGNARAAAPERAWYFVHDDKQYGPVSTGEIKDLYAKGRLRAEDLVWNERMVDWAPAGEVLAAFEGQGPTASAGARDNPFAAPETETDPAAYLANLQGLKKYAGFWRRLAAFVIDGFVLNAIMFALGLFVGFGAGFANAIGGGDADAVLNNVSILINVLSIPLNWLYFAILESSKYQATAGKMALGLVVTDLEGRRISFARATGRYFAKFLSGMILFVGFWMIGWTERKQGLHDILAGTLVYRKS